MIYQPVYLTPFKEYMRQFDALWNDYNKAVDADTQRDISVHLHQLAIIRYFERCIEKRIPYDDKDI